LKRFWNLNVWNGLAWPIWTLNTHKLWPIERLGVKLVVWLPTTKSRESPQFPCVQVACDIKLESSWQGLQLCVRPHLNQRFTNKVMGPQSRESPNFGNFGTLGTKCHLDVAPMARHIVYYKEEGGGFPQVIPPLLKCVSHARLWWYFTPFVLSQFIWWDDVHQYPWCHPYVVNHNHVFLQKPFLFY
jgi:hypothetical protein